MSNDNAEKKALVTKLAGRELDGRTWDERPPMEPHK